MWTLFQSLIVVGVLFSNIYWQWTPNTYVAALIAGIAAQTVSLDNVPPFALTGSTTQSAVSIDPGTGNVTVRSSTGTLTQCTGTIPQPPTITSFAPAVSSVSPGGNISLNWTSSNTTSCTPFQGVGTQWPTFGVMGTNGSQSFTAPQTLGTITFQLNCTNGTTSDTRTTQVTVEQSNPNCPPIYPGGMAQEFSEVIGPWPAHNDKVHILIPNNTYFSLHFTASADPNENGTISTTGFPGDGDGLGVVSISPGPGCFDANVLGIRCVSPPSDQPGVSWFNGTSQFVCKLNPGQSYHVNMYFPVCPIGVCGRDFGNIDQLLDMQDSPD